MHRNLDRRVEVLVKLPSTDRGRRGRRRARPRLRRAHRQGWDLDADGTWTQADLARRRAAAQPPGAAASATHRRRRLGQAAPPEHANVTEGSIAPATRATFACSGGGGRLSRDLDEVLAVVRLGEGAEAVEVDRRPSAHGHAERGDGGDRRGADAALEQGALAEDRAGPELGERRCRRRRPGRCRRARGRARRPRLALAGQLGALRQVADLGSLAAAHDVVGQLALQLALHRDDQRRRGRGRPTGVRIPEGVRHPAVPGRPARSSARPCPSGAVHPVPREGARTRELHLAGAVGPQRQRRAWSTRAAPASGRTAGAAPAAAAARRCARRPSARTAPTRRSCTGSRRSTGSGAARKVAPILPTRTVVAPITRPLPSGRARRRRPRPSSTSAQTESRLANRNLSWRHSSWTSSGAAQRGPAAACPSGRAAGPSRS